MPPMCKNHIEELIFGADVSLLMKCTFLLSRFRKHQLFTDCNLCRSVQGAPIVGPQAGLKNKWVKPLNSAGLGVSKCSSRGCTNLCEVNHSAKRRLAHPMFFFLKSLRREFQCRGSKKKYPLKIMDELRSKGSSYHFWDADLVATEKATHLFEYWVVLFAHDFSFTQW